MTKKLHKVTDPLTARWVIQEHQRRAVRDGRVLFDRKARDVSLAEEEIYLSRCHPAQLKLLQDNTRFKALICPRRTGKTTYNLFEVLKHDKKFPGSMIAYIVPDSKAHAKDLFWLPMQELNRVLNLGLEFREVEKRVITPNGTHIVILGAHDADSPKRLRGNPWSLVLLDECKDFGPHFEELVVEAVLPGLGDYGGTLCLSGTPGNVFEGLFYKVTTSDPEGWTVARWIKSDNTFLRDEERDLDKVWETTYKPFGIEKTSPRFRREQLAEWVSEESEQAYLFNPERDYWDGSLSPLLQWDHICGIDIGKRDKMVIQPASFSPHSDTLYYGKTFAERGLYIETMYRKWKQLNEQFKFVGTVVDTGGLGVMIVDDINLRYGVNWEAAQKGAGYKLGAVEQMNNDFMLGKIKSNPEYAVAKAWARSIRCPKTGLPLHSDECDAALYVHRYSYHWQGATPLEDLQQDTPLWWQQQEKEAIEHAVKERQRREAGGGAISDYD